VSSACWRRLSDHNRPPLELQSSPTAVTTSHALEQEKHLARPKMASSDDLSKDERALVDGDLAQVRAEPKLFQFAICQNALESVSGFESRVSSDISTIDGLRPALGASNQGVGPRFPQCCTTGPLDWHGPWNPRNPSACRHGRLQYCQSGPPKCHKVA
jgi:hypothetical protein